MTDILDIKLRPFSIRHRRLLNDRMLESIPVQVRHRLWTTLEAVNEYFDIYTEGYGGNTSDLQETRQLHARLLGLPEGGQHDDLKKRVLRGPTQECFDVLECFCAYLGIDSPRLPRTQRLLNETLTDFHLPWRMSEGLVFQVDNEYLEDEILADVAPLLGLAEFRGAHDEFINAREFLTEGRPVDAIGYAYRSIESVLKTSLGGSSKTGINLAEEYANKGLLTGLPVAKAKEVHKALTAVTTLRNALAGHGQGADVIEVPREYGELAVGLAAVINVFLTRQHLVRQDIEIPKKPPAKPAVPIVVEADFDDSDIPF